MLHDLILCTRLCGIGFIAQPSLLFHFHPTRMVGWKCFVPLRSQLSKGVSAELALKYFDMIHRVGLGFGFGWSQGKPPHCQPFLEFRAVVVLVLVMWAATPLTLPRLQERIRVGCGLNPYWVAQKSPAHGPGHSRNGIIFVHIYTHKSNIKQHNKTHNNKHVTRTKWTQKNHKKNPRKQESR